MFTTGTPIKGAIIAAFDALLGGGILAPSRSSRPRRGARPDLPIMERSH
jgi:hypothetical protein